MRHIVVILLFCLQSLAQVDLSSDALLKKSKQTEPNLDFGRFKVINQSGGSSVPLTPVPLATPTKKKKTLLDAEAQEAYQPNNNLPAKLEKKVESPTPTPTVEPKVEEPKSEEKPKVVEAPPLSEQV